MSKFHILCMRRDSGPEQIFVGDQLDNDNGFLCECKGVSEQHEGEPVELELRTVPKQALLDAFPAIVIRSELLNILKDYGFTPIEGPVYAKINRVLIETQWSIEVPCRDGVGLRG